MICYKVSLSWIKAARYGQLFYLSRMTQQAPVTIYNASAGTGKTYSLVKQYLRRLLLSNAHNKHRHLLAITFTNKAVTEMKERVLTMLDKFISYQETQVNAPTMLQDLCDETGLSKAQIAEKSEILLNQILQNYAAFDIITIDTLTHRIIRTFAKDLNIPSQFEVSLDTSELLSRAVDRVIQKAGSDDKITQTLVTFALQKADQDKDWNISRDLNKIAKLLTSENDAAVISDMQSHSLEDFDKLAVILKKERKALIIESKSKAQDLLARLTFLGIEDADFTGKTFFKFIREVSQDPENVTYNDRLKWQNTIDDYVFYKKATPDRAKEILDSIRDQLVTFFKESRENYYAISKHSQFIKNITPLSTLRLIQEALSEIKAEEDLLPISDFNSIIHESLREQPAAFIYERLGERYSNYFIDEFQDTSILQWHNLIPLIDNALVSQSKDNISNSLLLVGDPKQAIYRWRGGKAEQFAELSQGKAAISNVKSEVVSLDKNYRSHAAIVDFNNAFFSHIAPLFSNEMYENIYAKDNNQEHTGVGGGLVSLHFMEASTNEIKDQVYPAKVLEIINTVTQDGFNKSDICILVRRNKDGVTLAQFLSEQKIKVVSSESLFISNSEVVCFIVDILTLQNEPNNNPIAIRALDFIARKNNINDVHLFLETWLLQNDTVTIYQYVETLEILFSPVHFASLPLYEGVEYIIRCFKLEELSDAFVSGFLEVVFNYTFTQNKGLLGFLSHWEEKKEKVSIKAAMQKDAVQIMTIHKSKGLEFPVVIFPYADAELDKSQNEHHWYDVLPEKYAGFSKLMINHSAAVEQYSNQGLVRYRQRSSELQFDAINVLYVAFTRAAQRLYVVSCFRESENPKSYNELLIHYLKSAGFWEDGKMEYAFGNPLKKEQKDDDEKENLQIAFTSSPKEAHNIKIITRKGKVVTEKAEKAIAYGNLIHEVLAQITVTEDIDKAVNSFVIDGHIAQDQSATIIATITQVLSHPDLKHLFNKNNITYNEQAILSKTGDTFIPDRIVTLPNRQTTILDYKTGVPKEEHSYQLENYAALLEEMNFKIHQKLLVYINEDVHVIKV